MKLNKRKTESFFNINFKKRSAYKIVGYQNIDFPNSESMFQVYKEMMYHSN